MVATITWSFYAFTLATPGLLDRNGNLKGTETFFSSTHLRTVARSRDAARLYDLEAYDREVRRLVPETPETYFPLYPPQLSVLLEPLAHLPYGQAALVWSAVSIGLYLGACYLVWRRCSRLRKYPGLVATLALRSPAFFNLVAHGQTTSLSLLLLTAMLYPLASGRPLVAGMVFGSLIFKPHFGLAGTLVLLAVGEWRLLLGGGRGGGGAVVSWMVVVWRRGVFGVCRPRLTASTCLHDAGDRLVSVSLPCALSGHCCCRLAPGRSVCTLRAASSY